MLKTISGTQEKLELQSQSKDKDEEKNIEIKITPQFNKTFNIALIQQRKLHPIKACIKEEQEMIENIYLLYSQIKTKNLDNTNYSQLFF